MMLNQRGKDDFACRRTRVSELYRQGRTIPEIAQIVSAEFRPGRPLLSRASIYKDIRIIREEWRTDRLANFEAKVDAELARLDLIEMAAWEGWERSHGKFVSVSEKQGVEGVEVTTKTEPLAGDARFLDQINKVVAKRCELMGLNAPTKIDAGLEGVAAVLMSRITKLDNPDPVANGDSPEPTP